MFRVNLWGNDQTSVSALNCILLYVVRITVQYTELVKIWSYYVGSWPGPPTSPAKSIRDWCVSVGNRIRDRLHCRRTLDAKSHSNGVLDCYSEPRLVLIQYRDYTDMIICYIIREKVSIWTRAGWCEDDNLVWLLIWSLEVDLVGREVAAGGCGNVTVAGNVPVTRVLDRAPHLQPWKREAAWDYTWKLFWWKELLHMCTCDARWKQFIYRCIGKFKMSVQFHKCSWK